MEAKRIDILSFRRKLKDYCAKKTQTDEDSCLNCCMRLFCYTACIDKSVQVIDSAVRFLPKENSSASLGLDTQDFYDALRDECSEKSTCDNCDLRFFCYTPPCMSREYTLHEVIRFLTQKDRLHTNKNGYVHHDHYIADQNFDTPYIMDSTILGYTSADLEAIRGTI